MSPTARSLQELKRRGCTAAVVEKWVPGVRRRVDLFGCLDIVALEPGRQGVLGIQACVVGDQAKRVKKIGAEPRARIWLEASNRISVWGWAKRGPRGKRKTWTLTETPIPS